MHEGSLKAAVFRSLEILGILGLRERSAKGVPILAYHGVTASGDDAGLGNRRRLHVPARRFEEHLRLLVSQWHPVPLSQLQAHLTGRGTVQRRSVVITFDDGYRNVLSVALPLVRRFSVPATIFVLTSSRPARLWIDRLEAAIEHTEVPRLDWNGLRLALNSPAARRRAAASLCQHLDAMGHRRQSALDEIMQRLHDPSCPPDDDRDLLTWEEIRALRSGGMEIGSHAEVHEPLASVPPQELHGLLLSSRNRLEAELGPGPYPLAYPYGSWTPAVRSAAQSAGFSCALTTDSGLNRPGTDPFLLRRFLVGADDDRPRLRASLSGLRCPWRRAP